MACEKGTANRFWMHLQKWRKLTPEEQRKVRLKRLPRKVARSMAFEGEPVDQKMLEQEPERLVRQRGF